MPAFTPVPISQLCSAEQTMDFTSSAGEQLDVQAVVVPGAAGGEAGTPTVQGQGTLFDTPGSRYNYTVFLLMDEDP